jgi:hypothetical protein
MNELNQSSTSLFTVRQFAARHPAFPESSLRWLIFQSKQRETSKGTIPGNGLDTALVRIGKKLLIDETRFFEWVELHRQ